MKTKPPASGRIKDPTVELLAIKLYEHEYTDSYPSRMAPGWLRIDEAERDRYRKIARGEADLPKY